MAVDNTDQRRSSRWAGGSPLKSRERHRADVEELRRRVAAWQRKRRPGERLTLRRGGGHSNTTRDLAYKWDAEVIDVSALDGVLEIDPTAGTVEIEPGVTMERLFRVAIAQGLIPAVLPEFPGITVGGALQGAAGESTSFRHGLVHDVCRSCEMILGNGSLVTASRSRNQDLFYGLSGCFGTLGIMVRATLELEPAPPWVRLSYQHFTSPKAVVEAALESGAGAAAPSFLEGLALAPDSFLLIRGEGAEARRRGDQVLSLRSPWACWYHRHLAAVAARLRHSPARGRSSGAGQPRHLLPLRDYLFRYDRGAFWMGDPLIGKLPGGYNPVSRTLLSPLFTTRSLFSALHRVGEEFVSSKVVIQDFVLPPIEVSDFLSRLHRSAGIYPLWLCPIRRATTPQLFSPHALDPRAGELLINIGVYGRPQDRGFDPPALNRELEAAVRVTGGRKWLYAQCYYTRDEFWDIYDRPSYRDLRHRYQAAGVFHDVYEKIAWRPPAVVTAPDKKFFSRLLSSFVHRSRA